MAHFLAGSRLDYTKTMEQRVRAVYKQGVLYPTDPLRLDEMQEVTLTLNDKNTIDDDLAGYFTPEEWSAAGSDTVTWNDVRQAFAGIAGSLSAAVTAQRQER
jgi:predicted DNA-binding antitoxin AbrB/MazE fold protein